MRGGQVLQQFHFAIEMDKEGFVFVAPQDAVEKRAAGGAFLLQYPALAEAGVHEQAESERKVGLFGEIGDGLGLAVLLESEVGFGEIAEDVAVLVADGGEEIDGGDVEGDGRGLLADKRKSGQEKQQGD